MSIKVKSLEKRIWDTEGFDVVIKEPLKSNLKGGLLQRIIGQ